MFRTCVISVVVLAVAVAATAQPSIGKPFDIKVGASVTVGPEGLVVGFGEISGDSRCPIGLLCFWEGDAAALLWTELPQETRQDFQLHTFHDFKWKFLYGDYEIKLVRIAPYPVYEQPIPPGDYVATVQVDGGPTPVEDSTWGRIKSMYRQ